MLRLRVNIQFLILWYTKYYDIKLFVHSASVITLPGPRSQCILSQFLENCAHARNTSWMDLSQATPSMISPFTGLFLGVGNPLNTVPVLNHSSSVKAFS